VKELCKTMRGAHYVNNSFMDSVLLKNFEL